MIVITQFGAYRPASQLAYTLPESTSQYIDTSNAAAAHLYSRFIRPAYIICAAKCMHVHSQHLAQQAVGCL